MTPSGVDEFASVSSADLRRASAGPCAIVADGDRCSSMLRIRSLDSIAPNGDPRSYATFLATRPADAEDVGDPHDRQPGTRVSCGRAHRARVVGRGRWRRWRAAQAAGVNLTAETCPHYLTFASNEIPDGATAFKCAPPIRVARSPRRTLARASSRTSARWSPAITRQLLPNDETGGLG